MTQATNEQVVKAQDVKVGDVIKVDAYASIEVANIIETTTPDGKQAFTYYTKRGFHIWNRQDEELFKLN